MSLLSPDWHVLLEPGHKYAGGMNFEKEDHLVRHIPIEGSYPDTLDDLGIEPPNSLRTSICEFLILQQFWVVQEKMK